MVAHSITPVSNGQHTNERTITHCTSNGSTGRPLHVLIVGAGIGGLTAAIALREQGHEVTILEQSTFAQELGAAIHLAPNSNGILRRLGIYAEEFGANSMEKYNEYNQDGEHVRSVPSSPHLWQHPWLLAHRVRLHNVLKARATDVNGPGQPAKLLLSTRVVKVDPVNAIVTTESGKELQGDVVVGADGVHSLLRGVIPGWSKSVFDSGKSAFRFMIARKDVAEDPITKRFTQEQGNLFLFYGNDRRVVVYPTNDNEELNFVCIHPSSETKASGDWNNETSIEALLKVYRHFDPSVQRLLSKADPSTLKVWNLLDMDKLPTFVNGRVALLGDAAHPFLPHQGQGAGMAIEDAASIAVMLSGDVTSDEVSERLKLYNESRYDRAHLIQHFSRRTGQDEKDISERLDMVQYSYINFGHDEWDVSTQRLREYLWSRRPVYWRQPIAFGPMPGPRQDHYGNPREASHSTYITASIKFKTSRTVLQNLFPPGKKGYSFISPGTVAYASFAQSTINKMDWLGGSGYSHLGLYIHGVQYTKKDGTVAKGAYMPILFESLTDPIVSGREELGMPKLYASIDIHRRANSHFINAGWQGAMWGRFQLHGLKEGDASADSGSISGDADDGILVYRYMPSVGRKAKGIPSEEYPVYVPFKEEKPTPVTKRVFTAEKADFRIDPLDWEALPTLHHVISRLAEIPVYEIVSGRLVEGTGVPDVASADRLE